MPGNVFYAYLFNNYKAYISLCNIYAYIYIKYISKKKDCKEMQQNNNSDYFLVVRLWRIFSFFYTFINVYNEYMQITQWRKKGLWKH